MDLVTREFFQQGDLERETLNVEPQVGANAVSCLQYTRYMVLGLGKEIRYIVNFNLGTAWVIICGSGCG